MNKEPPVCIQCIQRCASSGMESFQGEKLSIQADSLIVTDMKSVPILANLASTFYPNVDDSLSMHSNLPVHVIPSSYKVGCYSKVDQIRDIKSDEVSKLLKWCHWNVKGIKVYNHNMNYCQSAFLQGLGASLSNQSVIVSSEGFTSGFNGLGVLTLHESLTSCEHLILGKPLVFERKKVIGLQVVGSLSDFTVSTDLVLQFIKYLRPFQDCIIEVWGASMHLISLSDRITISNMVKETKVQCIFFPCDRICAAFLKTTSNLMFDEKKVILSKEVVDVTIARSYDENHIFDLSLVTTSISGPKREIDRIPLSNFYSEFRMSIYAKPSPRSFGLKMEAEKDPNKDLHGKIVGVSLAGCTNSSNALVTLQAGLIASNLIHHGRKLPKDVNGLYATGAGLADLYLGEAGLSDIFVKYGMAKSSTCCIDQEDNVCHTDMNHNVITSAILSGNGNYENRKFPGVKANFLMSSPLALLYTAFGTINKELNKSSLLSNDGSSITVHDIWPSRESLIDLECKHVLPNVCYKVFKEFSKIEDRCEGTSSPFKWNEKTLYITRPPFLEMMPVLGDVRSGRVLLALGDDVTSEMISPSGSMGRNSTAAHYLASKGLPPRQFDSYGNRRGNHTVVAMSVFNNTKLQNLMIPTKGPYTLHIPSNSIVDIYDAAMMYKEARVPTIIIAGRCYGRGVARDSGARGVRLLGVTAVVARSFCEGHRRELISQGVMPVICEDIDCVDPTCEVTITWSAREMSPPSSDLRDGKGALGDGVCQWKGRLSWTRTTQSRVHFQNNTSVGCCSSVSGVPVQLAAYTPDEIELLHCGGLLKWRINDLAQRAERMRAEKVAKFNNNANNPSHGPYVPWSIVPNQSGQIYPIHSGLKPVVQFVPVLQYVPQDGLINGLNQLDLS